MSAEEVRILDGSCYPLKGSEDASQMAMNCTKNANVGTKWQ